MYVLLPYDFPHLSNFYAEEDGDDYVLISPEGKMFYPAYQDEHKYKLIEIAFKNPKTLFYNT